ncbi:hypothetical protein TWF696_001035 [Orbilia brochopaga]|uniref:Uncharacterized protein n=1 Tax=Orbilia brochopaga TaxID=3140254 RepID=A0AAV9VEB3_9PEZI
MPLIYPRFWRSPYQWARYHAHNNPAIFWSVFIGGWSPVFLIGGQWMPRAPVIPGTYPIPPGKRVIPEGFDDE